MIRPWKAPVNLTNTCQFDCHGWCSDKPLGSRACTRNVSKLKRIRTTSLGVGVGKGDSVETNACVVHDLYRSYHQTRTSCTASHVSSTSICVYDVHTIYLKASELYYAIHFAEHLFFCNLVLVPFASQSRGMMGSIGLLIVYDSPLKGPCKLN